MWASGVGLCHFLISDRLLTLLAMPMKRRYASRTGPASYKRAKTSARGIQSASTIRAPKRTKIEVKRSYAGLVDGVVGTSGSVFALPLVAAGSESDEREGRQIQIKGWEIRGSVLGDPFVGGALIRFVVFKWKQVLRVPILSDILYDQGASNPIYRSYNIEMASNYDILRDKVYNVEPKTVNPAGTAYDSNQEYVHLYGSANFIQSYQDPTLGAVCDQAIYVIAVSSASGSGLILQSATTFVDI